MILNHLNLPLRDVTGAIPFFETCFGFTCIEQKGDGALAVLRSADGFILVPMRAKEEPLYPKFFHIGFLQADAAAVDRVFEQLKSNTTLEIATPGKIRDTYGFYFYFDTLMIEISCPQSV